MSGRVYPCTFTDAARIRLGMIVLQSDVTLEDDLRRLLPASVSLLVSRVPSAPRVTAETLARMEHHLTQAAALFPQGHDFRAVGYGCTSGTAQIGPARIAERIHAGAQTRSVTDPMTALIAACSATSVRRVGLLSPYVENVSDRVRDGLAARGIETPVFGTFAQAQEARVARIDAASIFEAATDVARGADVDALFLSCTNLKTLDVIPALARETGVPVFSSNLVLAWHLLQTTGAIAAKSSPNDLLPGPA